MDLIPWQLVEIVGDPIEIWCTYSRVPIPICACERCYPLKHPVMVPLTPRLKIA